MCYKCMEKVSETMQWRVSETYYIAQKCEKIENKKEGYIDLKFPLLNIYLTTSIEAANTVEWKQKFEKNSLLIGIAPSNIAPNECI